MFLFYTQSMRNTLYTGMRVNIPDMLPGVKLYLPHTRIRAAEMLHR